MARLTAEQWQQVARRNVERRLGVHQRQPEYEPADLVEAIDIEVERALARRTRPTMNEATARLLAAVTFKQEPAS